MMRREISLAIALACAVAAVALPSVTLPRSLAHLVSRSPSAPSASPPPAAPASSAVAPLQQRLTALLAGTVGPGRAAVTVNATVDHNRVGVQSLRYSRHGVAVASQSARTRAGGYSAHSGTTTWAHSATVTSTAFAPGGARQLHIGLMVSTAVPRVTARRIAHAMAVAAGLNGGRGDTLALTRTRFASARVAPARTPALPAAARWALLAVGVLAFLSSLVPSRRESALT